MTAKAQHGARAIRMSLLKWPTSKHRQASLLEKGCAQRIATRPAGENGLLIPKTATGRRNHPQPFSGHLSGPWESVETASRRTSFRQSR